MTAHPSRDPNDDLISRGWPAPTPEEAARSRELMALIRREIEAAGGAIPFTRFMELALYASDLGYYSAPQPKFGEQGDYVTAPELSPLFGRCLANQVVQILSALGRGDILEVGAGSGTLAVELLLALEALGHLPQTYSILELSVALRMLQRQSLEQRAPHLLQRVQWLEALPSPGFRGVVLGNELLDAMPVTRFRATEDGAVEQYVCWDDERFDACERPASAVVRARLQRLALAPGYTSEIGLQAEAWLRDLAERLAQGVLLLVDYGFPRAEFYHPQRARGTLMCHYRQRAHSDPFILAGLQDITAHVDFSAIAQVAGETGLELLGYTSQAAFLIGCGLAEMASEVTDARSRLSFTQAINKLTAPHEMGELFKVIALGRGVRGPLRGFAVQDRSGRLQD